MSNVVYFGYVVRISAFPREGTFIAFDCETPQMRDAFVKEMRNKGVNVGGCGERGELFHLLLLQRPVRADGSLMCLL